MTFQSAPQCASAAIHFSYAGNDLVNVLNFHFHSGSPAQSNLQDLADAVDTRVNTSYKGWVSHDVNYDQVHVRGLTSIIDLEATSNSHAGAGTDSSAVLPMNVTNCITLRTGHTGRSARGRFYAVGPGVNFQHDGELFNTDYGDGLVTMLAGMITDCAAVGWDMIILSRFTGGVKRVTATHLDVNSVEARNADIDSQRGRLARNH